MTTPAQPAPAYDRPLGEALAAWRWLCARRYQPSPAQQALAYEAHYRMVWL